VEEGERSTHSFRPGWVVVGWCGCAVAASATAMRWHCVGCVRGGDGGGITHHLKWHSSGLGFLHGAWGPIGRRHLCR